jgi:hypothetical protein
MDYHTGSLKVSIEPQQAVTAGALWTLNGDRWHASGETVNDLPIGTYTITFKESPGWKSPEPRQVSILREKRLQEAGTWTKIP